MVKSFIFVLSFLFLLPLPAAAGQAPKDDGIVGTILEVEGSATVTPAAGGTVVPAAIDTPVHLNDTVQTAAQSRVFIQFIDDTELTLSGNTQARIDNYVFDPDDNSGNKASYSIMQGAFQYVSGMISHKENPDVHVDTPVGAIGIRGTNFWGGNLDGDYDVAVIDGQVGLKTDAGEETVNKGEGTSVHDRHAHPARAAALNPEKFRRMTDTVFLKRHDMVRKRVNMMRQRNRLLRKRYKKFMKRQRGGRQGQQQERQPQFQQQGQQQNQQNRPRERQMRRRERLRERQEQNEGGQ